MRGISFTGMLTILFIALKLLDLISWSWLWILSPIWISMILIIILIISAAIISMGDLHEHNNGPHHR